jgi:hypothetical protein
MSRIAMPIASLDMLALPKKKKKKKKKSLAIGNALPQKISIFCLTFFIISR